MTVITLQLTGRDPIVARDGRPFGAGQGNRMHGLNWPLPSVVAGSFRTALVKATSDLDFTGELPQRLMAIEVAGVFPTVENEPYLPAPSDCVWDERTNKVHRVQPIPLESGDGVDFPVNSLHPVRLTKEQAEDDFKAASIPSWWPVGKLTEWLTARQQQKYRPDWFTPSFLTNPVQEIRDHVCLDADRGAAAESQLFATAGLNAAHLRRFYRPNLPSGQQPRTFAERFAEVTLSVRVTLPDERFGRLEHFETWHPLGGERRLVHWQRSDAGDRWKCPGDVESALETATCVRMVLATPAIFAGGWRPGWLDANSLSGRPLDGGPALKLVGVSSGRWKAVSGWSLAPPRGPKRIRRMAPAGSVYFFTKLEGDGRLLATNGWLRPVSDGPQDRNDGFGLAVWGVW